MKTVKDLADCIMQMNHGDLRTVSAELAEMIDKDVRPKIETPQEFADALFDWAESKND